MRINENVKRYDKYKEKGALHWKLYNEKTNKHPNGDTGYKMMVDDSLASFEKVNKGTILDVGCGDGLLSYLLLKMGHTVEGVDCDETGLDIMKTALLRQSCSVKTYLSDIEDFVPTKNYDYMLCVDVIEHLENPTHILRLMKYINKFAIITTDNDEHLTRIGSPHFRQYTKKDFCELFNEFNLELIPMRLKYFFGYIIYPNK